MKQITIVGAGFSGLSLAYYLSLKGFEVTVIDKKIGPGGLISTLQNVNGPIETAANGFLNTAQVETFLQDIGADYIGSSEKSKKRFIFRGKPKRWPLGFFQTIFFVRRFIPFLIKSKVRKMAGPRESVQEWSDRYFTSAFTDLVLAPALQGIYAGDVQKLSAALIINPLLNRSKSKKLSRHALLSAEQGMGSIMKKLELFLKQKGVAFRYGHEWLNNNGQHLVIATSASDAAKILQELDDPRAKHNASILSRVEMESLVSLTCFFEKAPIAYQGFGVLFPRKENIRALGVLMNDIIFDRKSAKHSETWILGGATDRDVIQLSDSELIQLIQKDHETVFGDKQKIIDFKITRWNEALPHYTIEHDKKISLLKSVQGVSLHGNYLGSLGLSRILEKSTSLAETIAKEVP